MFVIGVMVDIIPQVPVWIPWTFSLQVDILVCAISSRPDLFIAVHDVSLMTPTQEGRLMAATTDMADVYLLWVERDGALLSCSLEVRLLLSGLVVDMGSCIALRSYGSASVGVGCYPFIRPNMLARAAPIEDAVVYNGSPRYPAWCTVGERVTAKPSRGHPCQYMGFHGS
ncbi:hypothetical protein O0I10_008096 [Lichtheimia ornata]|uniref:Uncharacterized protein n=1 Tax=Lichtheimia ornata TaxID=688661 RepID=A0AAD7XZT4_9FUNG|nr:uncharacterized protein O0I10_008096 [Lichtheimia ornata]KAJ8656302.1 hypothetical protein O0I10_008096 [Lichtheimia ornata]